MTEPHRTEVTTIALAHLTPRKYVARCSLCGWVSRPYESKRDAEDDADGHTLAMAEVE